MKIRNTKNRANYVNYNIGGIAKKALIPSGKVVNVPSLTKETQILNIRDFNLGFLEIVKEEKTEEAPKKETKKKSSKKKTTSKKSSKKKSLKKKTTKKSKKKKKSEDSLDKVKKEVKDYTDNKE